MYEIQQPQDYKQCYHNSNNPVESKRFIVYIHYSEIKTKIEPVVQNNFYGKL